MLIPLLFALQLHVPSQAWKVFARTSVAWRPDVPAYELLMEESLAPRDSDPDHRVRIRVPGRPDFTVVDTRGPGDYVPVREALKFADPKLVPRGLSDSARVLVLPMRGPQKSAMLAIFGWAYASNPYELTVIGFDSTGYPRLLFRRNFELYAVTDLDGDGLPEVIGNSVMGEEVGKCTVTYVPYVVYRLAGRELRYDEKLSRQYNEAHYIWAGPEANEDIEVEQCTPGKYRIVKSAQ